MHSTGTGQPVEIQDVFFWHLAGRSVLTGLAIVHWIGCINAIKHYFHISDHILEVQLVTKATGKSMTLFLLDPVDHHGVHLSI